MASALIAQCSRLTGQAGHALILPGSARAESRALWKVHRQLRHCGLYLRIAKKITCGMPARRLLCFSGGSTGKNCTSFGKWIVLECLRSQLQSTRVSLEPATVTHTASWKPPAKQFGADRFMRFIEASIWERTSSPDVPDGISRWSRLPTRANGRHHFLVIDFLHH
jgi:hypothetical protein